jgi:hypothetical protein
MALGLLLIFAVAPVAHAQSVQRGMPRAEKHESHHEIDRLEEAWRNAVLKSNATAMDALLADDFLAVTPSGTLQTKDQALANLRSGRLHFTQLDLSDRKVRFYGPLWLHPLPKSRARQAATRRSPAASVTRTFMCGIHGASGES